MMKKISIIFVFLISLGFYKSQEYKVGKNGEVTFEPVKIKTEKYSKTIVFEEAKKANLVKIITTELGTASITNTWTQAKTLKEATYTVKISGTIIKLDYTDSTKELTIKKKIKDLIIKLEAEMAKK